MPLSATSAALMPNESVSQERLVCRSKLSEKGRLVIPAPFRQALGIKTGDVLFLELVEDELRVVSFEGRLKRTRELFAKYGKPGESWVDELISERREEARREEEEAKEWLDRRARG